MKKTLTAVAILAVSGSTMAQSSVSLYGILDATLMLGQGSVLGKTQIGNSGYNTSRIGFRGTEDLGAGLAASFVLEAGVNNDDGTGAATNPNNQGTFNPATGKFVNNAAGGAGLTFNRRATVSLSGGFGEVRVGRDYTPQFWNHSYFDPFTINGVGASQIYSNSLAGPTTVRASNSVGYFLPRSIGGIYGQVQYYLGENSGGVVAPIGKNDGSGLGARIGYAAGPVNVALGYSQTRFLTPGNINTMNLGVSYDFGVVKVSTMYERDDVKNSATGTGYLLGANVPVGAGEIRAAYSTYKVDIAGRSPSTNKLSMGYTYNLSKRTAVYTTLARVSNRNGASQALNGAVTGANAGSTGYDFGVRHLF